MGVFRLSRSMIASVLGVEGEIGDDTEVSSINVRLDQMFREESRHYPGIVLVRADDLRKLLRWRPDWRRFAQERKTPEVRFKTSGEGLEEAIQQLNLDVQRLAADLGAGEELVFCHTPMFRYDRTKTRATLWLSLREVRIPSRRRLRTVSVTPLATEDDDEVIDVHVPRLSADPPPPLPPAQQPGPGFPEPPIEFM